MGTRTLALHFSSYLSCSGPPADPSWRCGDEPWPFTSAATCLARGHLLILAGDVEMNPGPSLQQFGYNTSSQCDVYKGLLSATCWTGKATERYTGCAWGVWNCGKSRLWGSNRLGQSEGRNQAGMSNVLTYLEHQAQKKVVVHHQMSHEILLQGGSPGSKKLFNFDPGSTDY